MLVLAAAGVFATFLFLSAAPASAHAVLISSSPSDGEQLNEPPRELALNFTEGVSVDLGGVTVFNNKGERVDDGPINQPTPEQLRVKLKPDLSTGTYVANYRVVSADGHPVAGALAFAVGTPVDRAGASGLQTADDSAGQALGFLGRVVVYLGALAVAGISFFLGFVHDGGPDRRQLAKLIRLAGAATVIGQVIVVASQAALASGNGIGAALDPTILSKTLAGSLGWATVLILTGTAVAVAGTFIPSELAAQVTAFYGPLAIAAGLAVWGHSSESALPWLSTLTDGLHVAAAAVWFGGLTGLTIVLVGRSRAARADEDDGADSASAIDTVDVVVRFSTAATIAIIVVAIAGVAMAWYEIGSLGALFTSTYGRVLFVKVAAVAAIAALGAYNHFQLVPAILDDEPDLPDEDDGKPIPPPDYERPHWRHLIQTVRIEALAIVVVLVITGFLVNLTPPRSATASAGPFNGTKPFAGGTAALTVAPALTGSNTMHVTFLDSAGRPAEIAQSVNVEMTLPDKGIGPLTQAGVKGGPGHFIVNNTSDMSIAGTWNVTLVTRLSEFDQQRVTFAVPITAG